MINEAKVNEKFSWPIFLLMGLTTFIAMVVQNAPSGVLPLMSQGLNVDATKLGNFVGMYALVSAISAIPLTTLTVTMNKKRVLMMILSGFLISNLGIAFASTYTIAFIFRLIGGVSAGLIWSMICPYGLKLAPNNQQGLAITVIIGGSTIGVSFGSPIFNVIGNQISWRVEFIALGILTFITMLLVIFFLPSVPGEQRSKSNSPLELIKNRGIQKVILLTVLSVMANYGLFTYMALLVQDIGFSGGIELASLLFGIGSFIAVIIAGKYLDNYLKGTVTFMMGIGAVSAVLFLVFGGTTGISHINFILWGIGFGALVTIFQNAITRQVVEGQSVAVSLQSASFNFAIMAGSSISGIILTSGSLRSVIILALVLLALATFLSITDKHTLTKGKL
ncbi:MFS transporter [Microaceticoccus formicicus]|uniref:MFS transporter n=1 Tax=Microaceticoccus formicicus TaxID=3118105 RepID=UPI003CD039BC|nr:MFS transporter [Peptoniphilaceae bacterium AMB_02]